MTTIIRIKGHRECSMALKMISSTLILRDRPKSLVAHKGVRGTDPHLFRRAQRQYRARYTTRILGEMKRRLRESRRMFLFITLLEFH